MRPVDRGLVGADGGMASGGLVYRARHGLRSAVGRVLPATIATSIMRGDCRDEGIDADLKTLPI
jgi:hypothetical protein